MFNNELGNSAFDNPLTGTGRDLFDQEGEGWLMPGDFFNPDSVNYGRIPTDIDGDPIAELWWFRRLNELIDGVELTDEMVSAIQEWIDAVYRGDPSEVDVSVLSGIEGWDEYREAVITGEPLDTGDSDTSSDAGGTSDTTGAWWENIPDWLITIVDGVRGIFDPSGVFIPIPTGGSGGGTTGTGSGSGGGEDTSGNTGDTSGNTETQGVAPQVTLQAEIRVILQVAVRNRAPITPDQARITPELEPITRALTILGTGTNDTGTGTNDTGAGTNDTGTNNTGSGTNNTGSGTNTSGNGSDTGGNGSDTGGLGDVGSACVMPDGGAGVVVMGDGGVTFCQGVGSTGTTGGGDPDNSCDCGNGVKGVVNAEGGCDCPTLQIPTPDVDPVGNDGECDCGNGVKGVVNQETGECQCPSIPTTNDGDTPPGAEPPPTDDGGWNIPLGFLGGGIGAGKAPSTTKWGPLFPVDIGEGYTAKPYNERPIAQWLYEIGEEYKP